MKKWGITLLLILFAVNSWSQLFTKYATMDNIDSMVHAVFGSENVEISNISYTGQTLHLYSGEKRITDIGYFNSDSSTVGIKEGMILTGGVLDAPYGLGKPWYFEGNYLKGTPGDSLLDEIIYPSFTLGAAILEFDFIPNGDSIKFNYVFASDEYPHQICDEDNDVFAFHISGPGINGLQNIALIPGTNFPVGNNTINDTSATIYVNQLDLSMCPTIDYPHLYVNHTGDQTFIFNGSTTVLTARAATIPCETYHLRFAVAEGNRNGEYSAVFLEANSFNSEPLSIESEISYGNGDTLLYEGCGYAEVIFKRTYNIQETKTYSISVSGTATNGVDYSQIPSEITLLSGMDADTLIITPFGDDIFDDQETVIITIGDTLCNGNYHETSLQLVIHEKPDFSVRIFPDSSVLCHPEQFYVEVEGAVEPIVYDWNNGLSTDSIFIFYPNFESLSIEEWVTVNIQDACDNKAFDSIKVLFAKNPSADFIFPPKWIDLRNPAVIFENKSSLDVIEWLWYFEDGGTSMVENPTHIYSDTGDYYVYLHVKNQFTCTDSVAKQIRINDIPAIYIPNTFSPNGDGINDGFKVFVNEVDDFQIQVYNRWGEVVYSSTSVDDSWSGANMLDGTYSYLVTVKFKNGKQEVFTGNINLIR